MNSNNSLITKQTRGRLRSSAKRDMTENLIETAEHLLRGYNHHELMEQKIAEEA